MSTALQPRKSEAQLPAALKIVNDAIIVYIEESDPAKQETAITSAIIDIMTKALIKYQRKARQAAKKTLHAPIRERHINVMLLPSPKQRAKIVCYRLRISDAGITLFSEKPFARAEVYSPAEPLKIAYPLHHSGTGLQEGQTANEPSGSYADDETPVIPISRKKEITVVPKPGYIPNRKNYPWLRFGGKYLCNFGFQLGQKVSIDLQPNKIILTVNDPGRQLFPPLKNTP